MINADLGIVKFKGSKALLLAELATIAVGLKDSDIKEDDILDAVKQGLKPKEELEKELKEKEELLKKRLANILGLAE